MSVQTAPVTLDAQRSPVSRDRLLPAAGAMAVRALGGTLRLRVAGVEAMAPLWHAGRAVIYVTWHGRILMMPWANARLRGTLGARPATVLASRSRDGELVARYAAHFGLPSVRGSSSRGAAAAVRALAAVLRHGGDVVLVPDGPRGPARRLQPGAVALAALTGAPIVPLAFAARPAVQLRTWDRFMVPLPFARAALVFGAPVELPRALDRAHACALVARALDRATGDADALVA